MNRVLTTLVISDILRSSRPDLRNANALTGEIERLVAVNRALDTKLLAVVMSMHARLGADSCLKVLDDHLVTLICDLFCRESNVSSL